MKKDSTMPNAAISRQVGRAISNLASFLKLKRIMRLTLLRAAHGTKEYDFNKMPVFSVVSGE